MSSLISATTDASSVEDVLRQQQYDHQIDQVLTRLWTACNGKPLFIIETDAETELDGGVLGDGPIEVINLAASDGDSLEQDQKVDFQKIVDLTLPSSEAFYDVDSEEMEDDAEKPEQIMQNLVQNISSLIEKRTCNKEDLYPFQCTKCDGRYKKQSHLKMHHSLAHPVPVILSQLKPRNNNNIPTSIRSSSQTSSKHGEFFSNKVKPLRFQCEYCNRIYPNKYTFEAHLRSHTGDHPYQCGQCKSKFARATTLRTHMISVHQQERPYRCTECNFTGSIRSNVLQHAGAVHLGIPQKRQRALSQAEYQHFSSRVSKFIEKVV